ncbi:MAG: GtrA family protein [Acidimicrobiales bacterium]
MDIDTFTLPRSPRDLWEWAHTHQGRKLIRYTSVSVVTTIVSFVTIAIVFGTNMTGDEVLATAIGNLVAAIPAYFLHRSWVWGKHGRSHLFKEVLPFWVMVVLGIGVSSLGAMGVRHLVNQHAWSHLLDTFLVSFANIVSFAVFWVLKILLFNRIFRVDTVADFDAHLAEEESH